MPLATTDGDHDRLCELIGNLPQELFDQILELTLTIDKMPGLDDSTDSTVTINEKYRPPAQLQLDRKTRQRALKAFYRRTAFEVFKSTTHRRAILVRWLRSLPVELAAEIEKIRYHSMLIYVYDAANEDTRPLPGETYRGLICFLWDNVQQMGHDRTLYL